MILSLIWRVTGPLATMTSAWRGVALSRIPKRSTSNRGVSAATISMSQALQAPELRCRIQGDLILDQRVSFLSMLTPCDQGHDGQEDHEQVEDGEKDDLARGHGGDDQGGHMHHREEQGDEEEEAIAELDLDARDILAAGIGREFAADLGQPGPHFLSQAVEGEGRPEEKEEGDGRGEEKTDSLHGLPFQLGQFAGVQALRWAGDGDEKG